MSEKYTDTSHQLLEHYDDPAETAAERAAEVTVENQAERSPADVVAEQQQKLNEALKSVAETQPSNNPLEQLKAVDEPVQAPHGAAVSRQLESIALQRELKNVRRQLATPQRALSRLIHQPAVRIASETAAKTVSRPSGLLGGGFMAFAGSLTYWYLTRHYGFRYNYLLFSLLFAGGFVVGVLLETVVWLVSRRKLS